MELEGETVKRLDSSNSSGKTAAVSTAAAQTRLGDDGGNKSNDGGANVAWLDSRGNTS